MFPIADIAAWPHHGGMRRAHRRGLPAQAGYSILAALVFVGVLGSIAAAVNILTPSGNPIASSASIAAVNATGQAQQQVIAGQEQKCDPGYDYYVYRDASQKGTVKIEPVKICPVGMPSPNVPVNGAGSNAAAVLAALTPGSFGVAGDQVRCEPNPAKAGTLKPKSDYKCKVQYCVAKGTKNEKCTEVGNITDTIKAGDIDKNLRESMVKQALRNNTVDEQLLKDLGVTRENDSKLINDVYQDVRNERDIIANDNERIDERLKSLAGGCQEAGATNTCGEVRELQQTKEANNKQLAAYEQQWKSLEAADKKTLDPNKIPCASGNCTPAPQCTTNCPPPPPQQQQTFPPQNPSGPGGQGGNPLGSLLQGLLSKLLGQQGQQCSADPNQYQQQQQQYQQQLQQYNYQLMQYNYQQQQAAYLGASSPPPPAPPQQCTPNPQQNTCANPPAQPTSGCTNGSWIPVRTNQNNGVQCTTGWQCGSASSTQPTAQLSCQPKVVDIGMSVALSFSCGNSTGSTGSGPNFNTENKTSGSATALVETPPAGATGITYALTCRNETVTARAECAVEIAKPAIVLVANPKAVASGATSRVGWVTSGMQSCIVSSPQMPAFTTQNASSTVVNGSATTSPITVDTTVVLTCETIGGATKAASTTITIATSTSSN